MPLFAQMSAYSWRLHGDFQSLEGLEICKNQVYAFSKNAFFSYHISQKTTQIHSKIDGFSENSVSAMRFSEKFNILIIAYQSGHLDLVTSDSEGNPSKIISIDLIKKSPSINGSKKINKIAFQSNFAYLASDFGLLVIDLEKKEIKETYQNIGKNGTKIDVQDLIFRSDSLYLKTSQGILSSKMGTSLNLQYFGNWVLGNQNHYFPLPIFPNDSLIKSPKDIKIDTQGHTWIADTNNGLLHDTEGKFEKIEINGCLEMPAKLYTESDKIYAIGAINNTYDGRIWRKITLGETPFFSNKLIDKDENTWEISIGGLEVSDKLQTKYKLFSFGKGYGNLPGTQVKSLHQDKNQAIWVGTDNGMAVIYPSQDIFSASTEAFLPYFQGRRLFIQESINSILTDPANRKWIGTNNGLHLFSAEMDEQLLFFDDKNSPLPTSEIMELAMIEKTGELFVLSKEGLFSFQGDATTPEETYINSKIYPNPVYPDYQGVVSFSDLKDNTLIKITDISGKLIQTLRSNGGRATWDFSNNDHLPEGSFICLIFYIDTDGRETFSGKLAFIR